MKTIIDQNMDDTLKVITEVFILYYYNFSEYTEKHALFSEMLKG